MSKSVILDSDVIIWFLRGRDDVVSKLKKLMLNYSIYTTPISAAEIFSGARGDEIKKINEFFAIFKTLEINYVIGKLAGTYLQSFSQSHGVELGDALIAASCKIFEMKLWTMNIKHYPMLAKSSFYTK